MTGSSPAAAPPAHARPNELARHSVGGVEVFAQAVAAAAPSVALASVPGFLFLTAAKGALLSAVIGAVVVVVVAYLVTLQARRSASSGSLGTFAGNGLGPLAAFTSGWSLVIGYLAFAASAFYGADIYLGAFLDRIGVHLHGRAWTVAILLLVAIPIVAGPYRGLRLSARAGLVFELVSLLAIGFILVASYVHYGFRLDTGQLSAHGDVSALLVAAVLAVGAYAGFESAASLGFEARDAHRTIPRAILGTVLGLVLLYLVATYGEVLSFTGAHGTLDGSSAPLEVIAGNAGVSWTGYVVDLGIAVAMVAFGAAVLNAGARSLHTFAKEGGLPAAFTRTHERFHSPHVGILALGAVGLGTAIAFALNGTAPLTASNYIGITGAFGYLVTYLLVSVATPLYLRRVGALTPQAALASAVATVAMAYVLYKNVSPAPPAPLNRLPYVFAGVLLVGLAWYAYLRVTAPETAGRIGSHQHELLDGPQAEHAEPDAVAPATA